MGSNAKWNAYIQHVQLRGGGNKQTSSGMRHSTSFLPSPTHLHCNAWPTPPVGISVANLPALFQKTIP